jgi:hypothetical protein
MRIAPSGRNPKLDSFGDSRLKTLRFLISRRKSSAHLAKFHDRPTRGTRDSIYPELSKNSDKSHKLHE